MNHSLVFTILLMLTPFCASAHDSSNQDPGVLELFDLMQEPAVKNGYEVSKSDLIAKSTVGLIVISPEGAGTCSGTLIASDIVMTAGHCVPKDFSSIVVYASYAGKNLSAEIAAEDVLIHPKFQRKSILMGLGGLSTYNDIALLRLRHRVQEPFAAAKLPGKEMRYESKEAVVAGWGRTDTKTRDFGKLRAGNTHVTSQSGFSIQLSQGGSRSAITCPGDSGGPVYISSGKSLVVIGIHSWGQCSYKIAYSESVGQHLAWIVNGIAKLRGGQEL